MATHDAEGSEGFWFSLNPFKTTLRTKCGRELRNPTHVDEPASCPECSGGRNSGKRPLF